MKLFAAFSFLFTLVGLVAAQDGSPITSPAPVIGSNPLMVTFQAILQASKPIQGTITGVSAGNGTGVDFNVNFFSFPDPSLGPYAYHIHVNRVPEDGNCTAVGGHLDPYNVTDDYKCAGQHPSSCQLGDLSGKHGKIDTTTMSTSSYQTHYNDFYLSTVEDSNAFFGNRSFVVHAANGTRLNCGNFISQSGDGGYGNSNTTGTHTGNSPAGTATGSGIGAKSSQTMQGTNGAVAGSQSWSVITLFSLGLVALVMAAL